MAKPVKQPRDGGSGQFQKKPAAAPPRAVDDLLTSLQPPAQSPAARLRYFQSEIRKVERAVQPPSSPWGAWRQKRLRTKLEGHYGPVLWDK
jgi:hypothetical protein